jgi:hypothetical protein
VCDAAWEGERHGEEGVLGGGRPDPRPEPPSFRPSRPLPCCLVVLLGCAVEPENTGNWVPTVTEPHHLLLIRGRRSLVYFSSLHIRGGGCGSEIRNPRSEMPSLSLFQTKFVDGSQHNPPSLLHLLETPRFYRLVDPAGFGYTCEGMDA